jgi:menaquinone-specific isochorismate synthase
MIERLAQELELFFDELPADTALLSITLPFHQRPFTAPLIPEQGVYWHSGSGRRRRLGLGCAWSANATGASRFGTIETAFQQLQPHWVHLDPDEYAQPPQLFFHYAFSEADTMAGAWQGLPNCELQLPQILLESHNGAQSITFSHPLQQHTAEEILQQWQQALDTLQQLLDQPAIQSEAFQLDSSESDPPPIDAAIQSTQRREIEKIVVAEARHFNLQHPIDLQPPLQRMERHHPRGVQLCLSRQGRQFFAAPPELLLRKSAAALYTEALAGTVPRGSSEREEAEFEHELRNHPKLQQEHQLVVDFIERQLSPCCSALEHPPAPSVHKLENIQHLQTPFVATLKGEHSLFSLVALLHQSPAICGTPREQALDWLQQHDNSLRGYYCGGGGWIEQNGDGEIHVLLRCGLQTAQQITLFAGAGVVAGSDPESEQQEINTKIQGMVDALSHPANGRR